MVRIDARPAHKRMSPVRHRKLHAIARKRTQRFQTMAYWFRTVRRQRSHACCRALWTGALCSPPVDILFYGAADFPKPAPRDHGARPSGAVCVCFHCPTRPRNTPGQQRMECVAFQTPSISLPMLLSAHRRPPSFRSRRAPSLTQMPQSMCLDISRLIPILYFPTLTATWTFERSAAEFPISLSASPRIWDFRTLLLARILRLVSP